jgi:hypothetical protein
MASSTAKLRDVSRLTRSWALRAVGLLLVGQTLVLGFGCAGSSERSAGERGNADDDSGGTAGASSGGTSGTTSNGGVGPGGTATTGGAPTTGGTATSGAAGMATGGEGGTSGAATGGDAGDPAGGASGVSGTGATAGEGGQPSSVLECETAADCEMASDWCGCRSEPILGPRLDCSLDCARDACGEVNIEPTEVACLNGRCVIARSCDTSRVTCPALPPNCLEGAVPSVLGDCWGPCIQATECSRVDSCSDCGDALCVVFEAQLTSYSCVERDDDCNSSDNYCGCLGIHCNACSATDPSVTCVCLVC